MRVDEWFRSPRHTEHARAEHCGDLRRRLADLAVDGYHQHDIARLRHAGAPKALQRGDERHAERAGFGGVSATAVDQRIARHEPGGWHACRHA